MAKLVQASTIACSSSAMLEQHGSTRSTRSFRLARHFEHVESCRDVTWRAKWNLGYNGRHDQRNWLRRYSCMIYHDKLHEFCNLATLQFLDISCQQCSTLPKQQQFALFVCRLCPIRRGFGIDITILTKFKQKENGARWRYGNINAKVTATLWFLPF